MSEEELSQGDETNDELEAQLGAVAEGLSSLSAAETAPAGYTLDSNPFQAEDVDFNSSAWLVQVAQVQAWLNLDGDLSADGPGGGATSLATELFRELGITDSASCFEQARGVVKPTLSGAEVLSARLDIAVRLLERFVELREDMTVAKATERWVELWDEEEQAEPDFEPINASTSSWPIVEFAGKAKRDKLNLSPSYQRGDVWLTKDCQSLIESVLRGIPLPSVIILKPRGESAGRHEVVDGKQRLTSLLRFMGEHPVATRRVEVAHASHPKIGFDTHFRNNYKKFRRLWKAHMGESLTQVKEAEYYFPFKLPTKSPAMMGHLSALGGKYYCDIRDEEIPIADDLVAVRDIFEGQTNYKIPLIIYSNAAPRQVHEVFHLYNRQGKHLNAEEIRNALYHELDLIKLVLVASGDNSDYERIAPFVPEGDHPKLCDISTTLNDYRFGTTRYKRTKLLSWLLSLVCQTSLQEDGGLSARSTAKHIDALFDTIRAQGPEHPLASQATLVHLVTHLHRCLDAHASCECWAPLFKDTKNGTKWQELQLVASLLGVVLIDAVTEDALDVLELHQVALREFTSMNLRPRKTQTKQQWGFIGRVALGILEVVGVDRATAGQALMSRYGANCIPTLEAAQQHYVPRTQG